jgi:hypothetical protein
MVSGSVPTSLVDRSDQLAYPPEGQALAKLEMERQIADLSKRKIKLLEEVKKLIKTSDDMAASQKTYREQTLAWKAEQVKEIDQLKATALKEQRVQGVRLDEREAELKEELEEVLVIYEYLAELADELVWWSSHNESREAELSEVELRIKKKAKEADQNMSEAESLSKKSRAMLESSATEVYQKTEAAKTIIEDAQNLRNLNKKLNDELVEKEKVLEAKNQTLLEKEKLLETEKVVLLDREATLARGFRELRGKQR